MSGASDRAGPPRRSLPWLVRWLHTYVSMFGFVVIVFFGATGLTLNHADWFEGGAATLREASGKVDAAWLAFGDEDARVDRLAIVEHLRAAHGVHGAVSEIRIDEEECVVVFKGPGYSADALLVRETGAYELTETTKGAFALIDDLHKGRDSGPVWAWVVDIAAGLTVVCGLTGIWLLWYVKKRRWTGLLAAVLGALAPVMIWAVFVP
ncbi:MAG: PepSY-associated TM helix domain-containing protein [Planctomycetes bacterium]|nr:PepSY-associated TM helix domain-containing protein [Planctomycetota bacterium]